MRKCGWFSGIMAMLLLSACGGGGEPVQSVINPTDAVDYNTTIEYQATSLAGATQVFSNQQSTMNSQVTRIARQQATNIAHSTQISEFQATSALEATQIFSNQQATVNWQATDSARLQATLLMQQTTIPVAGATIQWQSTEVAQLNYTVEQQVFELDRQKQKVTQLERERSQLFPSLVIIVGLLFISSGSSVLLLRQKNKLNLQIKNLTAQEKPVLQSPAMLIALPSGNEQVLHEIKKPVIQEEPAEVVISLDEEYVATAPVPVENISNKEIKSVSEIGEIVPDEEIISTDWDDFVAKAPSYYLRILKIILIEKNPDGVIDKIARSHRKMSEELLDNINELAQNTLGENIIIYPNNSVAVADEYRDLVSKQEVKLM